MNATEKTRILGVALSYGNACRTGQIPGGRYPNDMIEAAGISTKTYDQMRDTGQWHRVSAWSWLQLADVLGVKVLPPVAPAPDETDVPPVEVVSLEEKKQIRQMLLSALVDDFIGRGEVAPGKIYYYARVKKRDVESMFLPENWNVIPNKSWRGVLAYFQRVKSKKQ